MLSVDQINKNLSISSLVTVWEKGKLWTHKCTFHRHPWCTLDLWLDVTEVTKSISVSVGRLWRERSHGQDSSNLLTKTYRVLTGVCCLVWFTRYWGIITVPEFPRVNRPQMLTWGVPSSSSSNRPTMLTTRELCPGGSVVWAGPKFVRRQWWKS